MQAEVQSTDGSIVSIKTLLTDKTLNIPQYQRPYKWESRHVAQLLNDIKQFQDKSCYRLGTVVFHEEDGIKNIVDGQQRTITFLLVVKALIEQKHKNFPELKDLDKELVMFKFTHELTKQNIQKNYQEISRVIDRSDFNDSLVNFILYKCQVVTFTLTDVSEAFQFFDSQNARGRDLEPHDLLKAYHLREFSVNENHLKASVVEGWENEDTKVMSTLFSEYLFRIKQWSNGYSARYFNKGHIGLFKGVTFESADQYDYLKALRIPHVFIDQYNHQPERQIDGHKMTYPFQFDQVVINGRRFFEMINHYKGIINDNKKLSVPEFECKGIVLSTRAKKIFDTINEYPGHNRKGDRSVKLIFTCLLVFYIDKFGMVEVSQAIEKAFIWAYKLRLDFERLELASVDNYVKENNLFRVVKEAVHPEALLNCSLPTISSHKSTKTDDIVTLFRDMKYYV